MSATLTACYSLLLVLAMMVGLWPISLVRKNAGLIDRFWGPGFVLIAWIGLVGGGGYPPRQWLVLILTAGWGLRLAAHLTYRSWGQGEDPRYGKMRAAHGSRFALVSLFTVFILQALLIWIISAPIQC